MTDQLADAVAALEAYIAASRAVARLRTEAELAEEAKVDALVRLVGYVGRPMAADMAQVDEREVRSALATRRVKSSATGDGDAVAPPNGQVVVADSSDGGAAPSGEAKREPAAAKP